MRTNALWRLISTLLALLAGNIAQAIAAEPPPNIVLILADDLGYGDLGCYGQQRIQTPHLDQIAAEGMRFTQFYAGSTVCAPSRCVLMTGLHTGHCFIRGNAKLNLRPEDVTLAEVLSQAGYATGLVGKWGLGHEGSTGVPTHQGFDYFFGYLDQHHAHNYYPAFLMQGEARYPLPNVVPGEGDFGDGVASERIVYSHDLLAEEALRFVDEHRDERFFLYLALTTPHANNEGRERGMEVPDYGPYAELDWPEPQRGHAAMITRMDRDIGRLMHRLRQYGLDERTLVFFSSDNGPHREGGNDPDFNDSNGPLNGIKRSLTDGGIRVPTLARWPGKIPSGAVSDTIGYFADLLPTLAEVAGAEAPARLDGISLLPSLLGRPQPAAQERPLYWEFYEGTSGQAVRMGDYKAIRSPMFVGEIAIYDVAQDIGETSNIAPAHPELVQRTREIMEREHTASPLWKPPAAAGRNRPRAARN